ncbi:hypothetical protein OfM1_19150 [Lactovum odontotermitis]
MANATNENTLFATAATPAQYFKAPNIMANFEEVLGKKATGFVSSLLSVINNSNLLKRASNISIQTAAMKAATLDLPIEPSLGFAYIVPYKGEAQFQVGYKGLIQLALRSGQIVGLNSGMIYENQFISYDPMFEEIEVDFTKVPEGKVKGYFATMKLANGFRKAVFWSTEEVTAHGKRFSKTFTNGPWKTDFDAMAQKTVMKSMLSKYAPLSMEMQEAIVADNKAEAVVPIEDVTPAGTFEEAQAAGQAKLEKLKQQQAENQAKKIAEEEVINVDSETGEIIEETEQVVLGAEDF